MVIDKQYTQAQIQHEGWFVLVVLPIPGCKFVFHWFLYSGKLRIEQVKLQIHVSLSYSLNLV